METEPVYTNYLTISLDTAQPGLGFAAVHAAWNTADGQVYRTTDGGLSWSQVSANLPGGLRLLKLVPSPHSTSTLFAISGQSRFAQGPQQIFRSDDGGASWSRLTGTAGSVDLGALPLMDIAFHPADPATLYLTSFGAGAGIRGATFLSADGGASWQQVAPQGGVLFTDLARPNLVRRIDPTFQKPWESDSGTYESLDAGRTWARVSSASGWSRGWLGDFAYDSTYDGPVASLGGDMSDPNAIYWVTAQAVFGSFDGGRSFAPLFTRAVGGGWQSTGIDNVVMHGIAPSATNPNRVLRLLRRPRLLAHRRRWRQLGKLQPLEYDGELLGLGRRRDAQPGGRPGQHRCGLGHLRGSGPQPRAAERGGWRAHQLG